MTNSPEPTRVPPFLVKPHYVSKPWGGRRLHTVFGRTELPPGPVGESWEVAQVEEVHSEVEGGPMDGRPLAEAWGGPFPLLVKILDASRDLSVQVHPREEDEPPPKEEAWVALADGGSVAVGSLKGQALPKAGAWIEALDTRELAAADGQTAPTIVHVPAGTVHAIRSGAFIWEVQTPVDVTWRLDDYGRPDLDGHPRALHLAEAADVLARGPESQGELAADGRHLQGRRFQVWAHPAGRWTEVPGCVAFLPDGGVIDWAAEGGAGRLKVPRGRTVVLTGAAKRATSDGWMFAAGVR